MGQPTLSVIIPVYNAVKYLEKSVKSVQSQTLKNIEIILVDDGSRDGSSELCDRLAADDERIVTGLPFDRSCYAAGDGRYGKGNANKINKKAQEIEKLATQPFIWDIDLDYFAYSSCFCAAFVERISVLIKKAKLITIAKEPEYCPEHEDWNGQLALTQLMALLKLLLLELF